MDAPYKKLRAAEWLMNGSRDMRRHEAVMGLKSL
jgi:hypothetical protein